MKNLMQITPMRRNIIRLLLITSLNFYLTGLIHAQSEEIKIVMDKPSKNDSGGVYGNLIEYKNMLCFSYAKVRKTGKPYFEGFNLQIATFDAKTSTLNLIPNPDSGLGVSQAMMAYNSAPIIYGTNLYFVYTNATGINQLAEFDGTKVRLIPFPSNFSVKIPDIQKNIQENIVGNFTIHKNKLYFTSEQYGGNSNLLSYDGTSIKLIANPNTGAKAIRDLIVYGNELYFSYLNSTGEGFLAKYNDTAIKLITKPNSNMGYMTMSSMSTYKSVVFNGKLYFPYTNRPVGNYVITNSSEQIQLAEYNGTSIKLIPNKDNSSSIRGDLVVYKNKLYFKYFDYPTLKTHLARFNGSALDIIPNKAKTDVGLDARNNGFIVYGDELYFSYAVSSTQTQIAKYDESSIVLLSNPDNYVNEYRHNFFSNNYSANYDDFLYYPYVSNSFQLAKIDGEKLSLVPNISPTDKNVFIGSPVVIGGNIYFTYSNAGGITRYLATFERKTPKVKMDVPKNASPTSVNVSANASVKTGTITERGFVYALSSKNSTPTIGSAYTTKKIVSGITNGNFNADLTNLSLITDYAVCAYATNEFGTTYSNTRRFSTNMYPQFGLLGKGLSLLLNFKNESNIQLRNLTAKINADIFKPLSKVKIRLFSDPVTLAEGVVSSDGSFETNISIPDTTAAGLHHIVIDGIDSVGNVITKKIPLTIDADGFVTESMNYAYLDIPEKGKDIATFNVSDSDVVQQTLAYSIVGGADSSKFVVDAVRGKLTFKTAPVYRYPTDLNKDNIYNVVIQVKDSDSSAKSDMFSVDVEVKQVPTAPLIVAPSVKKTGGTAALIEAGVDYDGGRVVTEKGFVYALTNTNANPLIGGIGVTTVQQTGSSGVYEAVLNGLILNSNYTVKSYAINAIGTTYSDVVLFTTLGNTSGPFISYNPDSLYFLKNIISPLTPIQGGTSVPAAMYKSVSTFAGALGTATTNGTTNATGTAARFNGPKGMAQDTSGNIYVADRDNHLIRKITPSGVVTTLAGTAGSLGSTDATGTAAKFNAPEDIVIDSTNTYLYVADKGNHKIRKIDITTGVVTTFAGTGVAGSTDHYNSPQLAQFSSPSGLTIDNNGSLYVADYGSNKIRKITIEPTTGNKTLRFSGTDYVEVGDAGSLNFTNALTVEAWIKVDAFDKSWQTVIAKGDDSWRISRSQYGNTMEFYVSRPSGPFGTTGSKNVNDGKWHHVAGTYNGSTIELYVDGVLDGQNSGSTENIKQSSYIVSIGHNNQRTDRKWKGDIDEVRVWNSIRTVTQIRDNLNKSLQGNEDSLKLYLKFNEGIFVASKTGVSITANSATTGSSLDGILKGFDLSPYFPDTWTSGFEAMSVSTIAGTGIAGATDGNAKTTATFKQPQNIIINKDGVLYISEPGNHKIRKIENGVVSTLAGSTQGYAEGQGAAAKFNTPGGMVLDVLGNLYVADQLNHRIRKITASGIVSTFSGTGTAGATEGDEAQANFNKPSALLIDTKNENLLVADFEFDKIRKIGLGGYEISHPLPKGLSFDYTTGIITGTPLTKTYRTYYNNNFNDSALKSAAIYGTTTRSDNFMMLTSAVNTKSGALMVPASGNNEKRYKINFTLVTTKSTGGADGISYSFADDAAIDAIAPSAQVGTGTKLSLSFDDYENSGGERGIRLLYGTKTNLPGRTAGQNGLVAYSNNIAWIGKRVFVELSIDEAGKATVTVDSTVIFNKVQLPAAFITENKSKWRHIFRAATGGSNDIHGIDNLVIEEGEDTATYSITAYNVYGSYTTQLHLLTLPIAKPKISYTAQTFTKGYTITPMVPVNKGGEVPFGFKGQVTTFAGGSNGSYADGNGATARFTNISSIVFDKVNRVFYVSDEGNNRIRKITMDGTVSTLAGSGTVGFANGTGTAAQFNSPQGIAVDGSGNLYVADQNNSLIRKITPLGVVTTFAGTANVQGATDGQGTAASFGRPSGVAIDELNNLYVTDFMKSSVRKITPSGLVSTLAGSADLAGYADGAAATARFTVVRGAVLDAANNLYVSDIGMPRIRKITPAGMVSTFAGNGFSGFIDGSGLSASFSHPFGMAFDNNGNLIVADFTGNRIRMIDPSGKVSTIAGNGISGYKDGIGTEALFSVPAGVAVDDQNNIYITEFGNRVIRKINNSGGFYISPALPEGLYFDSTGTIKGRPTKVSPKTTYTIIAQNETDADTTTVEIEVVPDLPKIHYSSPKVYTKNVAISPLTPTNTGGTVPAGKMGLVTTIAGSSAGYADGIGTSAKFFGPTGITIDKNDNIYVAESFNKRIRKITPDGTVTTVAGSGLNGKTDGSAATATFITPTDLVINDSGALFIIDRAAINIRKLDPSGNVTTFAGSGLRGMLDSIGIGAKFNLLTGITTDKEGNLFVVDQNNHSIRKITPTGVVTTFAGNYKKSGYKDGQDTMANFRNPFGIAIDSSGNLYIADFSNHRIRKINPTGNVTTFAGTGVSGNLDGTVTNAKFYFPHHIAIDKSGNIYVTEPNNYLIRKIDPNGIVSTIAGKNGLPGDQDGFGSEARLGSIGGITVDKKGNLYVTERSYNKIKKISSTGYSITPELPAGLTLDTLGIISGTPTVISPKTTYTIIASNEDGSDTAIIELAVNETASAAVPTLTTAAINAVTTTTASSGGNITADGGAAVLERGVVWSTSPLPIVGANQTSNGTTIGNFSSDINGLQPNTQYYVRAFATNSAGTGYGNELSFKTSAIPSAGATPLSITDPTGVVSKVYDGTTKATVTTGTLSGLVAGDQVTLNATAQYENSAVGTNKRVIITYSLSGTDATKYLPPVNDTITIGAITAKRLLIQAPSINKQKVYDGNTNVQVAANALIGLEGNDIVTVIATASYDTKTVGTNKSITVTYTLDGANADNYQKPLDTVITDGVITKALLTVKAKTDAKFAGENDVAGYKGVVITGYVNGETAAEINQTGLTITRTNSGTNTSGDYSAVLQPSGITADNYSFDYVNGDYSIIPADQLLVRIKDTSVTYGANPVYQIEQAQYFKTGASLVDLTATTSVSGDTIIAHDGAVTTSFVVTKYGAITSSSNTLKVGTYSLDTANVQLSINVNSLKILGNYTVTPKSVSVDASGGATKIYDANRDMMGVQLKLNGIISGDNLQVSGKGLYDSKEVGDNKSYSIAQFNMIGIDADNYYLSGSSSLSENNGVIKPKQLTISNARVTVTKLEDGNTTATVTPGILRGVEAGDSIDLQVNAAYDDAAVGNNKTIKVNYTISGEDAKNYVSPPIDSFTNGQILDKQLVISTPEVQDRKEYDGTDTAMIVKMGSLTGVNPGDEVFVQAKASYNSSNVDTNKTIVIVYTLTGTDAYKYTAPKNDTINNAIITPKKLFITPPTVTLSKVYDGTTSAKVIPGDLIGIVNAENVTVSAIAIYEDKNVGDNKVIYVNYTLDGTTINNYIRPDNFSLTNGTITKAPLIVQVNDDAKFLGETDPSVYRGVSISGYVNGENITEVDTTSLVITRSNSGVENVGDYDTVLVANGLSAINYSFDYKKGKYSILPADHLLVKLKMATTIYGTKPTYLVESAKYFKSVGSVLIDLTSTTNILGDSVVVNDGATKTTFVITTEGATYSNANYLKVGAYQLDTLRAQLSPNILGLKLLGVNAVTPKTLTVSASAGVGKEYDGTIRMSALEVGLDTLLTGDIVSVNGLGSFEDRKTGFNKSYEIQQLQLSGSDANNYYLQGGNNNFIGTNGKITPKQLLVFSPEIVIRKFYDANTNMTVLSSGYLIGNIDGDDINISALANYDNASVGKNKHFKVVYSLIGTDTANYIKPVDYIDTTGEIKSPASFTVSVDSLNSFVACTNDTSIAQRFTITGVGLTASLTVNAPIGFELKDALSSSYDSTLAIVPDTAGKVNTTVYARMKAQAISPGNGNIIVSTTGLADDSIAVSGVVNALPTVAAISGTAGVCVSTNTTLANTTAGGVWSSSNISIATVNASGVVTGIAAGSATINYTVTNASGCATIVTKAITVSALPTVASISGTAAACVGSTTTLANTTAGGVWSSSNISIATVNASGVVTGIAAGSATITYTVMNANGCVTATTKSVTINALPIVTASINNAKADKGNNVVLSATGVGSFAWTPATNLINPDKATTVARVTESTTYTVTLTNANGCSSTASVLVEATDNMNFEAAYAFTPNGDGINDKFVIKNIDAYPDNKLMVYDRSGKLVYEATNYANTWDGKVNGFYLGKDSYFYVLTVKGQVVKRGAITLVR